MIFGMTHDELRKEERLKEKAELMPKARFAYFPKRLHDGRFIWLEHTVGVPTICGDYSLYAMKDKGRIRYTYFQAATILEHKDKIWNELRLYKLQQEKLLGKWSILKP